MSIPYHPWDWYIYVLIYHKIQSCPVGKYTSPMDPMGMYVEVISFSESVEVRNFAANMSQHPVSRQPEAGKKSVGCTCC